MTLPPSPDSTDALPEWATEGCRVLRCYRRDGFALVLAQEDGAVGDEGQSLMRVSLSAPHAEPYPLDPAAAREARALFEAADPFLAFDAFRRRLQGLLPPPFFTPA